MDTSVSDAPVGRLLSGRYRVGRRLARGGMATVYEAVDARLERTVALKVMHPDLAEDEAFVARFIGEARSAAKLSHPDVVAVFDQGADDGWVWLAMEYVRGRTLRAVLRERARLDQSLTLDVLAHVLSALDEAHRSGIVHRDVKPENVLVAIDGRVKVADFGLARAVAGTSSATTRGVLLGTVAYLSPEQALGRPATPRSDVYATGIMAYELLTGRAPRHGATDYLVVRQHIEEDVPAPSAAVPGIAPVVDALVQTATARDPDARYADAGTFLAAVRHARAATLDATTPDEQPTRPMPAAVEEESVPTPDRRRRRWGLLTVLLVLLVAVALTGAAYWYGWARYVPTPSLVGVSPEDAGRQLRAVGLSSVVASARRSSETVPVGEVVATEPEPGVRVLPQSSVTIVLSSGPERVAVPTLTGLPQAEALAALTAARLVAGAVTTQYDDARPAGAVVAQGVTAGATVRVSTAVDLVVSRGPRPVPIPDLRGADATVAVQKLRDLGLQVRSERAFSSTVPAGDVLGQRPAAGTLHRGDRVDLVVSRGPRVVTVPDVERKRVPAARAQLETRGLSVRVVRFLPSGPDRVLRQAPRAGTSLPQGSRVTLFVF